MSDGPGGPDAFSASSFQGPDRRQHSEWAPPLVVRTAVWLVKDVGVPIVLTGVFVAVVLGWVDSPLTRLPHMDRALVTHAETTLAFQAALLDSLRKQRCMTAVSSLIGRSELITAAALSADPCVYLEHLTPQGGRTP